MTTKSVVDLLLLEGLVNEGQIQEALGLQLEWEVPLREVLIRLGYVTEEDIVYTLMRQCDLAYLDASKYLVDRNVVRLLPMHTLVENEVCPLDRIGDILLVATSGTVKQWLLKKLESKTGCTVHFFVSTSHQLKRAIRVHVDPTRQEEGFNEDRI
ncbi:hypothetical protein MYX82_07830 [Acidobacteria bacterium AH-259-D05]|nr:hypothetical protein [Acidobacteria bacterium AH-259-D05]